MASPVRPESMGTKLARISQLSSENPDMVFTSIGHLINRELLKECHEKMDGTKAVGIDGTALLAFTGTIGLSDCLFPFCYTPFVDSHTAPYTRSGGYRLSPVDTVSLYSMTGIPTPQCCVKSRHFDVTHVGNRQSDSPIVPVKAGNAAGGKRKGGVPHTSAIQMNIFCQCFSFRAQYYDFQMFHFRVKIFLLQVSDNIAA